LKVKFGCLKQYSTTAAIQHATTTWRLIIKLSILYNTAYLIIGVSERVDCATANKLGKWSTV